MSSSWLADRMAHFDSSGIRKVFDLAATMTDPINLSIGQPDFDVPRRCGRRPSTRSSRGKNGYARHSRHAACCEQAASLVDAEYGHADRSVFVTSGTSGGLVLAMLALVNPGDEVIVFDPYFVMYKSLVRLAGGTCVVIDTYPDFRIDLDRVRDAHHAAHQGHPVQQPRPIPPASGHRRGNARAGRTGARANMVLISDEIYRPFCYDQPFVSPADITRDAGDRRFQQGLWDDRLAVGFAHGPSE